MNVLCAKSKIKNKHSRLTSHRETRTTCRMRHIMPFFYRLKIVSLVIPYGSAIPHTLLALFLAAGCASPNDKESLAIKIEQLTQENTQLQEQIEQFNSENKELKDQIQALSGLPENIRLENLNRVKRIKIGRYTGFFDKNDDGRKEKLIVYIQTIDEQGDALKAAGNIEVELWNLNKPDNKALLGQWKVGPDELKKLWFATMITSNYRLTFNVADIIDNLQEPLTLRVTFTDYLTGKVFNEQKAIKAP
jgi:outer membrane murein-binding lipoprotein Lpp